MKSEQGGIERNNEFSWSWHSWTSVETQVGLLFFSFLYAAASNTCLMFSLWSTKTPRIFFMYFCTKYYPPNPIFMPLISPTIIQDFAAVLVEIHLAGFESIFPACEDHPESWCSPLRVAFATPTTFVLYVNSVAIFSNPLFSSILSKLFINMLKCSRTPRIHCSIQLDMESLKFSHGLQLFISLVNQLCIHPILPQANLHFGTSFIRISLDCFVVM